MPNSTAVTSAAMLIAAYPASPAATTRRGAPIGARPATARYTAKATSEPTIAMLKQFAPRAVMPPSAKKNAWMTSAVDTARIAADGPSTMAASATPVACPVVPPGSGTLNIITTNENAAKSEMRGTRRVCNVRFRRRSATHQNGAAPAYSAAHVLGLRYPSGMCTPVAYHARAASPCSPCAPWLRLPVLSRRRPVFRISS